MRGTKPFRNRRQVDKMSTCGVMKGIDGLCSLVQEHYEKELRTYDLFLFCGRRTDRIKGILWEGDGFLLLYKRLDEGRFQWPGTSSDLVEISGEDYLMNVTRDGRLEELTNNRAERSIKPFVIGRKNFLFANTPKRAKASAILYSLVETAKETGVDPYAYFVYTLTEAANHREAG